jgi:molybdopterin-guanine dinucleotide biosynthesis protein MobB
MLSNAHKPLLGFAAYSGVGKTTLLRAVLPILLDAGIRTALVKHAHHDFDIDQPGKDSYELRKAGASSVLVSSARRRALMTDHAVPADPLLNDELACLPQDDIDLILVEGFRHEAFAKIELYRPQAGHPPIYPGDEHVIAVATDGELPETTDLPRLDINKPAQVAELIMRHFGLA